MTLVSASGEMSEVEVIAEVGSIEARGLLSGPLRHHSDLDGAPTEQNTVGICGATFFAATPPIVPRTIRISI